MKAAYGTTFKDFATTIVEVARICRNKRTRESRGMFNYRNMAGSSPFQKLVACIIATSVAPPDGRGNLPVATS
jgi:hypothetical protein